MLHQTYKHHLSVGLIVFCLSFQTGYSSNFQNTPTPPQTVSVATVSQYSGTEELIPQPKVRKIGTQEERKQETDAKRVETFSLLSFISSLVAFGLFFITGWGLLLSLLALILGLFGYIKIKENSSLYKGKAFAILGIIFGALPILYFLFAIVFIASIL